MHGKKHSIEGMKIGGDDIPNILATQKLPFFNSDVIKELKNINFTDKTVAHF